MMKRILHLAASTTVFGGLFYSYLYYHTSKNAKEYQKVLESETLRDASRLTNDTFGISWGFQADDIIMKKIDSGDIMFIKFDCSQCLSVSQYVHCFRRSMFNLEEEYDTIGYAYRDEEGLKVLYNQFGVTKFLNYTEMVSLPFLKSLMIQKGDQNMIGSVHSKLRELANGEGKQAEDEIEFANRINRYLLGGKAEIWSLKQLIKSEEQIHVRTDTNKRLRSV